MQELQGDVEKEDLVDPDNDPSTEDKNPVADDDFPFISDEGEVDNFTSGLPVDL